MDKMRIIFLSIVLIFGIGLMWILFVEKPDTKMDSTLAPVFQLFGKSTKSVNRALTRVMPINDLDEAEYGNAVALKYQTYTNTNSKEYKYLNKLIKEISIFKKKKFSYRVFYINYSSPNAFALPGGVIIVTRGLLNTLKNEAELMSILAHEMGHIELSHCLDAVRFQLVTKKIGSTSLGKFADTILSIMLRHSYSKTQENEADEYAYELILNTRYNPQGLGGAFKSLIKYSNKIGYRNKNKKANVLRDYFRSHPYLIHRTEKFSEMAKVWWKGHKGEKKYNGKKNLKQRISFYKRMYKSEMINRYL